MNSRDFVFWLQGYFEISEENVLGPNAVQKIKNHLNMVFKHEIDPSNGTPEHNKELSKIHGHGAPTLPGYLTGDITETKLNC